MRGGGGEEERRKVDNVKGLTEKIAISNHGFYYQGQNGGEEMKKSVTVMLCMFFLIGFVVVSAQYSSAETINNAVPLAVTG